MEETEKIFEKIYKSYGSDSGILFGIKEKMVVKAIIEFTLREADKNRLKVKDFFVDDTIEEF